MYKPQVWSHQLQKVTFIACKVASHMYFRQNNDYTYVKKKKKKSLLVIVMQKIYQQGVQNVCGCQWVYYMYICPHFMIAIPVLEGLLALTFCKVSVDSNNNK